MREQNKKQNETDRRNDDGNKCRIKDPVLVILQSGIPEICRFHSIREQHIQKRSVCIQLCDDAVLSRMKNAGIKRNKQIIQQSPDDGGKSINHRLPCQLFN